MFVACVKCELWCTCLKKISILLPKTLFLDFIKFFITFFVLFST